MNPTDVPVAEDGPNAMAVLKSGIAIRAALCEAGLPGLQGNVRPAKRDRMSVFVGFFPVKPDNHTTVLKAVIMGHKVLGHHAKLHTDPAGTTGILCLECWNLGVMRSPEAVQAEDWLHLSQWEAM